MESPRLVLLVLIVVLGVGESAAHDEEGRTLKDVFCPGRFLPRDGSTRV